MTTSINSQQIIGGRAVTYYCSSDLGGTPLLYYFIDGILVETTTRTYKQISLESGETVQFEVLDDPNESPQPAYPGRLHLAWYTPDGDAVRFRVEEYIASVWTQTVIFVPNPGQTYFRMQTRVLEDDTVHRFRAVPIGSNERDGFPVYFTVRMVRRPDAPSATFAWDQLLAQTTCAVA